MDYYPYPIVQPDFYRSQVQTVIEKEKSLTPQQFKEYEKSFIPDQKEQIHLLQKQNGIIFRSFELTKTPTVSGGFYKPVSEKCAQVTGLTGPSQGTTSLFNNMTRRKSLVKDY
jgi:hypothetical protein|tara:strand:- start:168 stop:506 length:339 start_codon:yes stop_codon:yes gene_type:complete